MGVFKFKPLRHIFIDVSVKVVLRSEGSDPDGHRVLCWVFGVHFGFTSPIRVHGPNLSELSQADRCQGLAGKPSMFPDPSLLGRLFAGHRKTYAPDDAQLATAPPGLISAPAES